MNRFSTMMVSTMTALALGIIALPAPSAAQLSGAEQSCLTEFAGGVAEVGKAQGNIVLDCVKRFASGRLVNSTVEACMFADRRTKLTKAFYDTDLATAGVCSTAPPPFGFSPSSSAVE